MSLLLLSDIEEASGDHALVVATGERKARHSCCQTQIWPRFCFRWQRGLLHINKWLDADDKTSLFAFTPVAFVVIGDFDGSALSDEPPVATSLAGEHAGLFTAKRARRYGMVASPNRLVTPIEAGFASDEDAA